MFNTLVLLPDVGHPWLVQQSDPRFDVYQASVYPQETRA